MPVVVAGLTLGARPALLVGTVAVLALALLGAFHAADVHVEAIATLTLIVLGTLLVWGMMRAMRTAHVQAQTAEAATAVIRAREQDLVQSNAALAAANAELERMVAQVAALEVPVIPLLDGVLLLPLVGDLDTRRLQALSLTVLAAVHTQRSRQVLIDLTGVTVIDAHDVAVLLELIAALRLLGTTVALTGIRATTAATLSTNGIDLHGVDTPGRLQDAIGAALDANGNFLSRSSSASQSSKPAWQEGDWSRL